jgi:protein phosphatase
MPAEIEPEARVVDCEASLSITGTMVTHPGRVREVNEDVVAYLRTGLAEVESERNLLAVVADGMGGHAAGEVASRIAADTVLRLYLEQADSPPDALRQCMAAANEAIYKHSRSHPECAGMGTTCTILAVEDGTAYLAHIGDSRAYLVRDGKLYQISQDHSLVAEMVRAGQMTEEEAARSPQRNVILRALGIEPAADPWVWRDGLPVRTGDVFVLCSDGLSDLVADSTIRDLVTNLDPFEACDALRDAALAAGGTDNISVGVFSVLGDALPPSDPGATRPVPIPENVQ